MTAARIQVSPSLKIFDSLTYTYTGDPALLRPGLRVVVPVVNRLTGAWVTQTASQYKGQAKKITAVVHDPFTPDPRFIDFITAVSRLYFTSVGTLLDAALPPKKKNISSLYFVNPDSGKREKLNKYPLNDLMKFTKDGPIPCFYGAKGSAGIMETLSPAPPHPKTAPSGTGSWPGFNGKTGISG